MNVYVELSQVNKLQKQSQKGDYTAYQLCGVEIGKDFARNDSWERTVYPFGLSANACKTCAGLKSGDVLYIDIMKDESDYWKIWYIEKVPGVGAPPTAMPPKPVVGEQAAAGAAASPPPAQSTPASATSSVEDLRMQCMDNAATIVSAMLTANDKFDKLLKKTTSQDLLITTVRTIATDLLAWVTGKTDDVTVSDPSGVTPGIKNFKGDAIPPVTMPDDDIPY